MHVSPQVRSARAAQPGRDRLRGFTLLEILVAFVVLAAGAGILYRTFSTGINNVGTVAGYTEALGIAEAKLGTVGLEKPLAEGEESGTTEDRRFEWRVNVQPYTPAGELADPAGGFVTPNVLYRATVTVSWDVSGPKKRSIDLTTLRIMGRPPA